MTVFVAIVCASPGKSIPTSQLGGSICGSAPFPYESIVGPSKRAMCPIARPHLTRNMGNRPSFVTSTYLEKKYRESIVTGSEIVKCGKNEESKDKIAMRVVGSPTALSRRLCLLAHFLNGVFWLCDPSGSCGLPSAAGTGILLRSSDLRSRRRCLLLDTVDWLGS